MDVKEREPGDIQKLKKLIVAERDAEQRDRYRIALFALEGWDAPRIAEVLSSNRRSVQDWVYRYRDQGIPGLIPRKHPGSKQRLGLEAQEAFKQRIIDGPRKSDGVCTLRAKDAQRILNQEFGIDYKLSSVYELMHRLGLSCLKPRPRHEDSDPQAMRKFAEESAPFLFASSSKPLSQRADGSV